MEALPPLLLVGGGRMGSAMLAGWREQGLAAAVVVDPSPGAAALAAPGVRVVVAPGDVPDGFVPAAVVLAVKPQAATETLPAYQAHETAVFISIMAGKTVAALAGLLGREAAIIRAMPNTPAAVRQGITVAFAGPAVSAAQRALADRLLAAIGTVEWVDDEALLDPVTAISGGGPAYVFLLVELLEQAGRAQGLAPALAARLARQTIIGSGGLLAASTEPAAALRQAVTSPNGTTERALAVMMRDDAWPKIVAEAIEAATQRSRQLSG